MNVMVDRRSNRKLRRGKLLLLERILENDDTTSRSTHRDRKAPQEVLKPPLFLRTSLEKKER
jgi:hypothetical protein